VSLHHAAGANCSRCCRCGGWPSAPRAAGLIRDRGTAGTQGTRSACTLTRRRGTRCCRGEFPGGILVLERLQIRPQAGADACALRVFDEVDAYPASARQRRAIRFDTGRGPHPRTFAHRARCSFGSRPQRSGACPASGASSEGLPISGVTFVPAHIAGRFLQLAAIRHVCAGPKGQPETASYHCEAASGPIAEHHKDGDAGPRANGGQQKYLQPKAIAGFHLSRFLFQSRKSCSRFARDWLAAQGSDEMLRARTQHTPGETWVESGEESRMQRLADRSLLRFASPNPRERVVFLTGGRLMCRRAGIEVDVWALGPGTGKLVLSITSSSPVGRGGRSSCWDQA